MVSGAAWRTSVDQDIPPAGFYSPREAARLARVPLERLREWARHDVIVPDVRVVGDDGALDEGYSFEAVVYLRLLRELRERNISFSKSVAALVHLRDRFGPPGPNWADARLGIVGKEFDAYRADEWESTVATLSGQKRLEPQLVMDLDVMADGLDALLAPKQFRDFVSINPAIQSGLPVVRGTALPTALIASFRKRGDTPQEIQRHFPQLHLDQIEAALQFERFLDDSE
jgi:uncharacterized protein (DUF433 family)